jgi:acyl-CoA thioesterase-1
VADRRLLLFGDSFVAGVGHPSGRGWVGRLAEATFAAGLPVTTYNLGVRRETSLEVAARWWGEAQPRLMPGTDCGVVFSFGANDTTIEDGRLRAGPEQSRAALENALSAAARGGLRAFVVGPPPVGDEDQQARVIALSASYASICREASVPYVDVARPLIAAGTWLDEAQRGDGAHPGAEGYAELAELVLAGGWLAWLRG